MKTVLGIFAAAVGIIAGLAAAFIVWLMLEASANVLLNLICAFAPCLPH